MQARPSVLQRKGASFTLRGKVSDEVKARMKGYGISVRELSEDASRIDYDFEPDSRALKLLVARINMVIQAGNSPEYVAAFVHQEIALFHGFNGGNGRLGRLLAQILYKKLTGKSIVFPKEFHRELEYSAGDLANSISVAQGLMSVPYPPPNLTYLGPFGFRGGSRGLAKGVGPVSARSAPPALPPQVTVRDANTMRFASLDTAALPLDITHARDVLYYGRPAKSEEDAVKNMKILFQYGRSNRGGATFDLYSHVNDTKKGPRSGFFSTSKTFWEAYTFAGREHDGIVYVIDGAGAPGIDIEKLAKHLEPRGLTVAPEDLIDTEHEFALTGVDPRQIKGAWLRKGSAFEFVPNPNYDPHWRYPGP
jgi:hypothetical protein